MSSVARGVAAGTVHTAVTFLAGPIVTAAVVRALSTTDAAFWFVLLSFATYFALFDLGLGPSLARHVAFARGAERVEGSGPTVGCARSTSSRIASEYRTAVWLNSGVVCVVVAVGLAVGARGVFETADIPFDAHRAQAWRLFVLGCAANLLASPPMALSTGFGNVAGPRWCRAGAQLVGVSGSLVALSTGAGLLGVAAAWLVQNVVLLVAGYAVAWSDAPGEARRGGAFKASLARAFVAPSLRWAGMNAGAVLILASGPLIVARVAGAQHVPSFVALRQLGEALYVLAIIPAQASEPLTSMLASAARRGDVIALFQRNARHVVSLILAGSAVLLIFGGDVTALWVGPANYAGTASLALAVMFFALECHHVMHAITLMATGDIPFLLPAALSGVLTVALGVLLTREYGVAGMLLAMVAAQLLTNNWYAPWVTLRRLHVSARQYMSWLLPAIAFGAVMLTGAVAIRLTVAAMLGSRTVVGLATALGLSLCLLLGLAWGMVLSPGEREWVIRRLHTASAEHV